MNARAYYNDNDPACVAVLKQLIADGVIAPGDVDDRSIKDVGPDDLAGYTQCHFFAGGGLWSVAARMAGWPDTRSLWTASCPCQPFSAAGKGLGADDPRHLWPDLFRLIRVRRPVVVVGEQVAGKAGYRWFDGVRADLATEDFASRAADITACAVDAPHQRNRLYWIAVDDLYRAGLPVGPVKEECSGNIRDKGSIAGQADHRNGSGLVANGNGCGRTGRAKDEKRGAQQRDAAERPAIRRNGTYWSDAERILCHDGKARRAQSGIRMLVDGFPGRVDLWRITGNAIVPQVAAEVLAAFLETEDGITGRGNNG